MNLMSAEDPMTGKSMSSKSDVRPDAILCG